MTRSEVDENFGYVWAVTFMTELGDLSATTMDVRVMTGTFPLGIVEEVAKGVSPPFNARRRRPRARLRHHHGHGPTGVRHPGLRARTLCA